MSTETKIKAVVFDYGGVICFLPSPEIKAEIERLTGLPPETFRELDRRYRGEWDRGTYNGPGYYRFLLENSGIFLDDASVERIVQTDLDGWKRINPGTLQLMREIKTSGLLLGVLSNMSHDFTAWARDNVPVLSEADAAVLSSQYNVIKPETEIYQKLKERLGVEYEEIVFFDDSPVNVKAAQALGIQAIIWERPETARELLINLGIGLLT